MKYYKICCYFAAIALPIADTYQGEDDIFHEEFAEAIDYTIVPDDLPPLVDAESLDGEEER